jgi:L-malate glycosyltransferase
MRVCQVMTADLWAGAEVQVATTASYLVAQPDIELSAVLFNDGWLAGELRRLGVDVAIVDEHRYSSAHIWSFIRRFLVERHVDIVHTHRSKDTVLGAVAAKCAGVRSVVRTVHGLSEAMQGWPRVKLALYGALDKLVLWFCADRVVAVSTRMASRLRTSGYRPGAITCIHNGINLGAVTPRRPPDEVREAFGIRPDAFVIGAVGRFAPVKGHEFLVRAMPQVLADEPGTRLLLVGAGSLRGDLVALAERLGVADACLFVDPARDPRFGAFDLMAAMDAFVLPSLSEGIPLALLEAMALGTPAIATCVGGVPEIVTHGHNGLLVPPRDAHALAGACLVLARDRQRGRILSARARRTVGAHFSHEISGDRLARLYRAVAERRHEQSRIHAGDLVRAAFQAPATRVRRKIEHALMRWRLDRMRRTPAAVTAVLGSARRVLVVCHGNIIRSPFAALLLARALGSGSSVAVASAGLEAERGRPSHPTAVETAAAHGIDLSRHAAAPIDVEDVERTDVIFVMDVPQLVTMGRRFPSARSKTFLLTCLAPGEPLEISDPVDGAPPVFRHCYEHVSRAVSSLAPAFAGHSK